MPKTSYDSKAESLQFELVPDGDYPFEVVAFDLGISAGGKTNGSEKIEMKVAFYKDVAFTKRIGQWTEQLIFHSATEWKVKVFARSANMLVNGQVPADGAELDFSEDTMIGLRGWATVRSKEGTQDKTKRFNYVAAWLTNKGVIARNTPAPKPIVAEDDVPF